MLEWLCLHVQEIFLIAFGFTALVLLLYYFFLFAKFSFHTPKKIKNAPHPPVSIVISSRNEAHHLIKTLPHILSQQYLEYEVVVVNDNSTDETEQVIRDFMVQYPHLKFVNLTSSVTNIQGKKFPLSIGIKSASHEVVLLTDADCIPSSPYWLLNMAKHFRDKTKIVLGYSTYEKKNSLMNLFVHFDNLQTAIQYFSYTLAGIPYMGIGRNLAYTRSLFYEKKGFASHNHIHYGDDEIFINRSATAHNCDIEYFKEAFTVTRYKSGFGSWFRDKLIHAGTKKYFKAKHKFLLNTFSFFTFLFYLFFILTLVFVYKNMIFLLCALGIFLVKTALHYVIFGFSARKLEERRVIPYILPFDIFSALISPFIFLSALFSSYKK